VLALGIDLALGDPPNRWHPVAWMGSAVAAGRRRLASGSRAWLLASGGALTLAVATVSGAVSFVPSRLASQLGAAGVLLEALVLSTLLSVRGLVRAARLVDAALARGDVPGARALVAFHLVSRDTGALDEGHVVSATIESVAENLCDSVIAPVCFYLAFGLAGAAVYRAVNTADAMIGYRAGALEHFGKVAAWLDDALNLLPARLAGVAIGAGAAIAGADARGAGRVMRRDAGATASPNAGWPMAALAGALGVELEKVGFYRLGAGGAAADAATIARADRLVALAAGGAAALAFGLRWALVRRRG
jgi:adenosylcobinamide-phosphate synthase